MKPPRIMALTAGAALFAAVLTGCTAVPTATPSIAGPENGEITLYFVRHGKTIFNDKGIVSGWSDSPLTAKGVQQAKNAGAALDKIDFTTAYSSDLGRARDTANEILTATDSDAALKTLPGMREQNYGGFEGDLDAELWKPLMELHGFTYDESWSQAAAYWSATTDEQRTDDTAKLDETGTAENWLEYKTRIDEGMQQIIDETRSAGGGSALVVSHGGTLGVLFEMIDPEGYNGETIENASITTVSFRDGMYTIKDLNRPSGD